MKVLQIIAGISMKSGGPTRSVKGLCRALDRAGEEVELMLLGGTDAFENPGRIQVIYGASTDREFIQKFQVVHLHGLWSPKLHQVAVACRRAGVPYVVSPRGMLDPWALSVKKWKKRIARWLYQDRDLQGAAAFHATAELEAEHIREQGFRQPMIIAPNAVELPEKMPEWHRNGKVKTAIFLSRLHPGKGLLTLTEAWAKVRPQGWRMKVVGPDNYGHKKEVIAALNRLGIADEWEFCEPLDDVQKWDAYRSADLLIHPSVSENFGVTIAEGLAAGLPVICTKGAPWKDIEEHKCGWWIDIGVEQLARALQAALSLRDKERQAMGESGRMLIAEKYTWDAVAERMIKGYEEVLK